MYKIKVFGFLFAYLHLARVSLNGKYCTDGSNLWLHITTQGRWRFTRQGHLTQTMIILHPCIKWFMGKFLLFRKKNGTKHSHLPKPGCGHYLHDLRERKLKNVSKFVDIYIG